MFKKLRIENDFLNLIRCKIHTVNIICNDGTLNLFHLRVRRENCPLSVLRLNHGVGPGQSCRQRASYVTAFPESPAILNIELQECSRVFLYDKIQ